MALTTKASNTKGRQLVAPGKYGAVVVGIADLGTQTSQYGAKHQIAISLELHQANATPFLWTNTFKLSLNIKASLRPIVEGFLGRMLVEGEEFNDYESLVGRAAVIKVKHKPKESGDGMTDFISDIELIPDGQRKPTPSNSQYFFEITHPGCRIPQEVPGFLQDKIQKSPEWLGAGNDQPATASASHAYVPAAIDTGFGDDVPF